MNYRAIYRRLASSPKDGARQDRTPAGDANESSTEQRSLRHDGQRRIKAHEYIQHGCP